jgi:centrosomal protein CEP104
MFRTVEFTVECIAQGIWRPVLGRLQLLLHAVPLYGIQPPSRTGFPSDALMNFVTQAFNSPNGEVRNAAIKVTTEVYRLMGPPIDKYLKGIKPLIREVPFPPQVKLI